MSYLVLARRLRPSRFDDLIGQETNSKILRNAVISGRVAHAFLFAGSRGVGKTSAARILTRAINCLKHENGNPCNNCTNCIDISNNASPDIFEIDAASNRGIDNIRELRENVNYVPSRCKYKVYIIDEAHMLTLESFNALLKTLEEPPSYVKFIFATTDPHKIPLTIKSRCQRYDFLRISVKKISDYLENIIKDEKLQISRNSLDMIAQNSYGGMRDALTSIDQILSIESGDVSDKKVAQILGLLDHESRFIMTDSLLRKKNEVALLHFQKLQEHGYDVNDILTDLLNTIKTISLIQTLGTQSNLFQDISSDVLESYEALSKIVSIDELQQIFQILLKLEESLKVSSHSKICFEMAILQITSTQSLVGIKEIISEIKNLRDLESVKKKTESKIDNETKNSNLEDSIDIFSKVNNEKKINYINSSLIKTTKNLYNKDEKNEVNEKFNGDNDSNISFEQNSKKQQQNISIQKEKTFENLHGIESSSIKNDNSDRGHLSEEINKSRFIDPQNTHEDFYESKQDVYENNNINFEKPSAEWFKFSDEAKKISPKLASFIRNAIPESFSSSEIKLSFKSGNYSSLLDEKSIDELEKIASDLGKHPIKITCNPCESISIKKTIAEYEKIIFEKRKKIKRENAMESSQVKGILSVFKNSKISKIQLIDE